MSTSNLIGPGVATDLFKLSIPAPELAIRSLSVYVFILVLLRIAGKRQLGQMGATEFVALLLISNAVQNSMNGGDNSLLGGLLLACVLIAASTAISYLTYRSRRMRQLFEGTPRLLIHKGKAIVKSLRKERMTDDELKTLLRKQGVHRIQDVQTAVLEADGTLSITRNSDLLPGGSEEGLTTEHPSPL